MLVKLWSSPIFEGGATVALKMKTDYMTCDTAAFSEGDEVIVKFEDSCIEKPVVIGFWDDPRPCGLFVFTMTRADGQELDTSFDITFTFRNKNQTIVFKRNQTSEYVTVSGNVWSMDAAGFSDGGEDEDGYWVNFTCGSDNHYTIDNMQYPDKHLAGDQYQAGDRIDGGNYSMVMALWRVESATWDNTRDSAFPNDYSGPSAMAYVLGVPKAVYMKVGDPISYEKTICTKANETSFSLFKSIREFTKSSTYPKMLLVGNLCAEHIAKIFAMIVPQSQNA